MSVSDMAIEAAAVALWNAPPSPPPAPWSEVPRGLRLEYQREARAVVDAYLAVMEEASIKDLRGDS